jgi:hypothetical protein
MSTRFSRPTRPRSYVHHRQFVLEAELGKKAGASLLQPPLALLGAQHDDAAVRALRGS